MRSEALGERESNLDDFRESAAAYRAALTMQSPTTDAMGWEASENGLGYTLEQIGKRETGTGDLLEADCCVPGASDLHRT
jgi:hypothetical protein